MLSSVGQIAINVHDLARAVAFYRGTLGLPHLFSAENMAFFDCGGVRLMLALAEKPELDHPASIVYYRVEDIGAVHKMLVTRGVKFDLVPFRVAQMPAHDLWMAFFRDSENNPLALMSEVPRAAA
ncbi:MAG TPA: VOC family protein [Verrucomicrobiae bacterium]|jgi:methylmalonyl-CoA/ethylmalonyl-CoA epimerase